MPSCMWWIVLRHSPAYVTAVMDDPTTSPTHDPSSSPVTSSVPTSAPTTLESTPFYDPLSPLMFYVLVGVAGLLTVMVCVAMLVFCCCCCCCRRKRSKNNSTANDGHLESNTQQEGAHEICISPFVSSAEASFADIRESPGCKKKEAELNASWATHGDEAEMTLGPQPVNVLSGASGNSLRPTITEKDGQHVGSPTVIAVPVCLEVGCGGTQSRHSLTNALPPSYDELEFSSYPTVSRTGNRTSD